MITIEEQKTILATIEEGNTIEHGTLFAGIAPEEDIVWRVTNVFEVADRKYVKFGLYYFDILFREIKCLVEGEGKIMWGVLK